MECGYRDGYTYDEHHYTPVKVEAPAFVIEDSKRFIGQKTTRLL